MAYWTPVQTWVGHERKAARFLREIGGFECYLPMRRQLQIRFRRPIEYHFPLYPRYLFARIELQWHQMTGLPGVTGPLKKAGTEELARVPDQVIDALRARERDGAIDLPNAKYGRKNPRIGDRVQIVLGPFMGQSGI